MSTGTSKYYWKVLGNFQKVKVIVKNNNKDGLTPPIKPHLSQKEIMEYPTINLVKDIHEQIKKLVC